METVYCLCNPLLVGDLNRSLMRLLRPAHLRDGYATDKLGTEHFHPVTGYGALALNNSQAVPVHIESDGAELQALTDIFVTDGAMFQEEADQLSSDIAEAAGTQLTITEFIPPSWLPYVLSEEDMTADGWFITEEEEG